MTIVSIALPETRYRISRLTSSQTKGRLLANPQVQMGDFSKKIDPKTSGRWDLRGQRFLKPNDVALKSWGVCIVDGCVEVEVVQNFMRLFMQTYVCA